MKPFALLLALAVCAGCTKENWREHRSQTGAYSISMPGTPQHHEQQQPTPAGIVNTTIDMVDLGDRAYAVNYSDFPEVVLQASSVDMLLRNAQAGAMASSGGSLVEEKELQFAGNPAREFSFRGTEEGKKISARCRLILVGNRLYQLLYMGTGDIGLTGGEQFFNSFKLL
jgi:hypothetical protein